MVVTDPFEYEGVLFNEDLKIDRISKFLNQYSYSAPKFEKKVEIQELNAKKHRVNGLCSKKSSNLCLIAFVKSPNDHKIQ